MKIDKQKVKKIKDLLEGFENLDIYEYIEENDGYQKIFEEAKDDTEKEAAKDFAKNLSGHFSEYLQSIVGSLLTEEGLQEFCDRLNKKASDHGNR